MSPRWAWGTAAAAERECPGGATEGKSGSGPRPRVPRSEGVDVAETAGAASPRLEDLGRRLARALQRAVRRGCPRRPWESVAAEERSGARGDSALDQLRAELVSAPWRPQGGPPRRPLLSRGFRPRGPPEGAEARGLFRDQESEGVQRQGARRWPSIFPGRSPLLH